MRKQTKLVAVTSAAALLTIGASMTSFAATGWTEEAGDWYYYDSDGYAVEDEWKKSGDKWFWLSSEEGGAMAVDSLVDDDDDLYYVDSTGAMVTNTWIKVVNEDQDDDDPAEYHYYYMASTGKAYTGSGDSVSLKTIDGKRYAFDEDGKMLYGWVDTSGERLTGEEDWKDDSKDASDVRYFGSWDDGAVKTGWQYISVVDDDDDCDYWFYFNTNGTRWENEEADDNYDIKKINSVYYGFDQNGVMVYEWNVINLDNRAYYATGSEDTATATNATGTINNATLSDYTSDWSYFNSPEDGARVTKGWFKVIPPDEDTTFTAGLEDSDSFDEEDAGDEDVNWYYADGDGYLYAGEIKSISGKYYAFAPDGEMLSGLVMLEMGLDGEIYNVIDSEVDSDELSDYIDGTTVPTLSYGGTACMYYFGDSEDGSMKTGTVTVDVDSDGNNSTFKFATSGGVEGKGIGQTGIDGYNYIYKYGLRIKADSDDKYQLVYADEDDYVVTLSSSDLRYAAVQFYEYDDGDKEESVKVAYVAGITDSASHAYNALEEAYDDDVDSSVTFDSDNIYLVTTSGSVVKSKSSGKDGAEWYFYVDTYNVKAYANENSLNDLTHNEDGAVEDDFFDDWKNFTK